MARQPLAVALALSLGLHGVVGVWVKVSPPNGERPEVPPRDAWVGRGIEIDRTELEAAPLETAPSEVMTANEPAANEPDERTVGVEPVCASDCVSPDAKPRSTERARPEKPKAGASVATPFAPATPSVAAPSTSVTAPSAASDASGTPANEPFGAVGLPAGVRFLPKAYARALNQGSFGVAGFRTVPAGKLCEARVSIAVGEDKKLGPLEYVDDLERERLPALCRTMLENGHRLVAAGEFSLDPKRIESGVMRLHVEIEVTDGTPHPDAERDPKELFGESHEAPTRGRRGRSTFILNSGRRVDAFIDIE